MKISRAGREMVERRVVPGEHRPLACGLRRLAGGFAHDAHELFGKRTCVKVRCFRRAARNDRPAAGAPHLRAAASLLA